MGHFPSVRLKSKGHSGIQAMLVCPGLRASWDMGLSMLELRRSWSDLVIPTGMM